MNNWDPRVNELFMQAIELSDPAERAALLDRLGDADLRRRVEALLKAHDEAGGFLREPHPAAADDQTKAYVAPSRPDEKPGTVVAGRYKLLEPIGEGGMGTVWVAEQTEPVRRKVALKLIKAGMDSKSVLARFEAERQALAVMDHPNIAKVLDGGATESGRPFFVMEYVKGVPITEYCDAKRLSVPERLTLFAQVCQAVQHAHQKGIIHRDLKPSNILVAPYDDRPVPKVIDFGLAKAMHQSLTERTLHTAHETVLGTPLYMSPEQAQLNNLDVDTRSDVYSLGVLLYELLTGSTPLEKQRFKEAAWEEVKRIIREEEPPRPSTRLSSSNALASLAAGRQSEPTRLTNLLRGELDWIVMKALEKDRTRRYETANGFAADVLRYLAGEPVQAHPPSTSYRLKKFIRRHRVQVIAAGAVAFALIAGVIGTTYGLFQADRALAAESNQRQIAERKQKEAELERARAEKAEMQTMADFEASTDDAIKQLIGSKLELGFHEKRYIENALKRWEAFANRQGDDERSRSTQGFGQYRIALLWQKLGRREEALAAYKAALSIQTSLVAQFSQTPTHRRELADTRNSLGILLADLGDLDKARTEHEAARNLYGELIEQFPNTPDYQQAQASLRNSLGAVFTDLNRVQEAIAEYEAARRLQQNLVDRFPTKREYQRELAVTLGNQANQFAHINEREHARRCYESACKIHRALIALEPDDPDLNLEFARCLNNFGVLLRTLGETDESLANHRLARDIGRKLVTRFPSMPDYKHELASTHNNLGILLFEQKRLDDALIEYRAARDLRVGLVEQSGSVAEFQDRLARTHANLGNVLSQLGKNDEALGELKAASDVFRKLAKQSPQAPGYRELTARTLGNIAIVLKALGRRDQARMAYKEAHNTFQNLVTQYPKIGAYQVALGVNDMNHGLLQLEGSDLEGGVTSLSEAIKTLGAVHQKEPRDVITILGLRGSHKNRAAAYDRLSQHAAAIKDWDKAIELSPSVEKPSFRASRANSQLHAGLVAEAVAEVAALTALTGDESPSPKWNPNHWYDFACVYAVASGKIADKKKEYADRAMELLAKAVKAGYKDAGHMKKDTDFDALRSREDFKKLIAEMEATSASMKNSADPKQPMK